MHFYELRTLQSFRFVPLMNQAHTTFKVVSVTYAQPLTDRPKFITILPYPTMDDLVATTTTDVYRRFKAYDQEVELVGCHNCGFRQLTLHEIWTPQGLEQLCDGCQSDVFESENAQSAWEQQVEKAAHMAFHFPGSHGPQAWQTDPQEEHEAEQERWLEDLEYKARLNPKHDEENE